MLQCIDLWQMLKNLSMVQPLPPAVPVLDQFRCIGPLLMPTFVSRRWLQGDQVLPQQTPQQNALAMVTLMSALTLGKHGAARIARPPA